MAAPTATAPGRWSVHALPSMTIEGDTVIVGDSHSTSQRSWTPVKELGTGNLAIVSLVDWHSVLPPGTRLAQMQCGAGARPEWSGKVLVALKTLTRPFEGGWDECRQLKELQSLRSIPPHENIISLYDTFIVPTTNQLHLVLEPMEGNLYQLIKSRKGRTLAPGLVSSIFAQAVNGLHHVHAAGYFHRDMKPENLLVTTTGLATYAPAGAQDVVVTVKIADFGLARETSSTAPLTQYVAVRWYRAPEILLRSAHYSSPVDVWALGVIMAELVNLKPLFPGRGEIDQLHRITHVLGDLSGRHGVDARGRTRGGGAWPDGVQLAASHAFVFPQSKPQDLGSLLDPSVPTSLVEVLEDLLRYDPAARLTTAQLLDCRYMQEMRAHPPPTPTTPPPTPAPFVTGVRNNN